MKTESPSLSALLPWEIKEDFHSLREAFVAEYGPEGPTEAALVERLVWMEWRRRRLRLAERAAHMVGLADRLDDERRVLARAGVRTSAARDRLDLAEVVTSDQVADAERSRRHGADREATTKALAILDRDGANAYALAMKALHPDTRAWWEDGLAGEYGDERAWRADGESLSAFLREEVVVVDAADALADQARPAVRLQAFGESLDPVRVERLLSIEGRLDRQFEKALSMLLQLQEMRLRGRTANAVGTKVRG